MSQIENSPYAPDLNDLYHQAITAYKNGRYLKARNLLQQIVQKDKDHAKAWFGLGQIEPQIEDRLFALTVGLSLNPDNQKAQSKLAKIENDETLNHFTLAQRFETFGLTDTAVIHYQKAEKSTPHAAIRDAAKEKQQLLQKEEERIIIDTTATTHLLRLTFGPIIIYLLLIVTMSGVNPLQISLPLLIGGIVVTVGSFLITSANQDLQLPIWNKIFGAAGLHTSSQRYLITGIGIAFLLLPFAVIFITNFNELTAYYAIHPVKLSN